MELLILQRCSGDVKFNITFTGKRPDAIHRIALSNYTMRTFEAGVRDSWNCIFEHAVITGIDNIPHQIIDTYKVNFLALSIKAQKVGDKEIYEDITNRSRY
jgi:hypothetical protein